MKVNRPDTPKGCELPDGGGLFWAGFCPRCGRYDPVFGQYRMLATECCSSNHESYQELYQRSGRGLFGMVTSADE